MRATFMVIGNELANDMIEMLKANKDCAGALNLAGVSVIDQLVKEHDCQCAPGWGFDNLVV